MVWHESLLPLGVAGAVAVALPALRLARGAGRGGGGGGGAVERPRAEREVEDWEWPSQEIPESDEQIPLGQDRSEVVTVNWIAHDHAQMLLGLEAEMQQPALQRVAEAVEQAPFELDPRMPGQMMRDAAQAVAGRAAAELREAMASGQVAEPGEQGEQVEAAEASEAAAEGEAKVSHEPAGPGEAWEVAGLDVPDLKVEPGPFLPPLEVEGVLPEHLPVGARRGGPGDEAPSGSEGEAAEAGAQAGEPVAAGAAQGQAEQAVGGDAQQARPTAAERDEREVAPMQLEPEADRIQAGQVVAAQGVQIKTAHPRFSAVTRSSVLAAPSPRVMVAFDAQGQILHARLLRSTGHANVDGPILASLYRWEAEGEALGEIDEPFSIEIEVTLR